MALKRKLSKEDYEKLPDSLKSEYAEKDGVYYLDVEGFEDPAELRRAKDREKTRAKEAEKKLAEAEERLAEIEGNDALKANDVKRLDASWKAKHEKTVSEYEERVSKREAFIKKALVDNVAQQLAAGYKNPALVMPHIAKRLSADLSNDEYKTTVLDENGQLSALSVEDLKKELDSNPMFSDMLVVSKASGGGTPAIHVQGGGAPLKTNLVSAPTGDLVAHLKTINPGR